MIKKIGYFIDKYTSILPDDTDVGSVVDELWYKFIKPLFDDKVWNDFYNRKMLEDSKFCINNDDRVLNNIKKTIAIHFKTKSRLYNRLFNAYMSDYNPLWNVDGVTGTIRESTHTGTDTNVRSGSDTLLMSGGHSNIKTGDETYDYDGTESTKYYGSEKMQYSGDETLLYDGKETTEFKGSEKMQYNGSETHTQGGHTTVEESNTTFESGVYYPAHKSITTPTDTDTLTFTNRSDDKSFQNREDEKSFTNREDRKDYGKYNDRYDEKSYDNREDEKSFNDRTDTHSFNYVTDEFKYDELNGENHETTYDSQNEKTLDLQDNDVELVIRQGNIGVTKSSELLADTLDLYGNNLLMDFVYYVVHDTINQLCSMVY